MGSQPRYRPFNLSGKLREIRAHLQISQSRLADLLGNDLTAARVSEYEHGRREPSLITLLRYSQVSEVVINDMVDDSVQLDLEKRRPKQSI